MLGEFSACVLSVRITIRSFGLTFRTWPVVLCCILMVPYLVISARYGNVQPFAMAFVLGSLVSAKNKPGLSGLFFALAVTLKVTPLFFLPWFFPCTRETFYPARSKNLIPDMMPANAPKDGAHVHFPAMISPSLFFNSLRNSLLQGICRRRRPVCFLFHPQTSSTISKSTGT